MGEQPDHYRTLQVDPAAEPELIRIAYRYLARQHHPDGGGAPGQMAALNAAYAVLRDPVTRAAYDARLGRIHRAPTAGGDHVGAAARPGPLARARAAAAAEQVPASPPWDQPTGGRLDFGRYAGWSIAEVAASDPDFLEWLDRMPIGRIYWREIDEALRKVGRRALPAAPQRNGLLRRR